MSPLSSLLSSLFKCSACDAKNAELLHLRAVVDRLLNVPPLALQSDHVGEVQAPPLGYYGDKNDLLDAFDPYGMSIAVPSSAINQKNGD